MFWLKPSGWNSPKKGKVYIFVPMWWIPFYYMVWYGMVQWCSAILYLRWWMEASLPFSCICTYICIWGHLTIFLYLVRWWMEAILPHSHPLSQLSKYKLSQSAKASFSSGRFVSWFIFITIDITMCLFVLFLCEELPNYFQLSVERKYEYEYSTVQICATNWQIWATSIEIDFENIL